MPYFYKIQHKESGRFYVGCQYKKESKALDFFSTYFTSSKRVHSIIEREGVSSFQILVAKDREDAREYEKRYLQTAHRILGRQRFLSLFINRNIAPGVLLDDESKEKLSKAFKGRVLTEEHKRKIGDAHRGMKRSKETREKMSEANKGKPSPRKGKKHSPETIQKMKEAHRGKKFTAEHKAKIASASKGRKHSEKSKEKMRESKQGNNHPMYGRKHSPETREKMKSSQRARYDHKG